MLKITNNVEDNKNQVISPTLKQRLSNERLILAYFNAATLLTIWEYLLKSVPLIAVQQIRTVLSKDGFKLNSGQSIF